MRSDLNRECENLEIIIENLISGKDKCEILDDRFSMPQIIDYLRGFLEELKSLNNRIIQDGNTKELLKEVYDKYSELWLFQVEFYVDSLVAVVRGLWRYPNDD